MKTTKKTLKKYQFPKPGKSNQVMTPEMIKREQEAMIKREQAKKDSTSAKPMTPRPKDPTNVDNKYGDNTNPKLLPKEKKGGSTKAKKFAALAPPYNKATAADRIAGAKKSKSSKKK